QRRGQRSDIFAFEMLELGDLILGAPHRQDFTGDVIGPRKVHHARAVRSDLKTVDYDVIIVALKAFDQTFPIVLVKPRLEVELFSQSLDDFGFVTDHFAWVGRIFKRVRRATFDIGGPA